ncbi:sigma-E factor negative regulatory protein [Alteromonas oceanisediminis]|uniref:sigma-E factor negative regulatory protein n=1 Tax=Alteromonas oceanisediminis TaxID=2836180 RepID=UPI001BD9AF07|nr:RseA family anti-sigma factor [Alteromonas oceanisediminis]MBT0585796.1 transcriptional regulator [Alteromonas oceanisediminis]
MTQQQENLSAFTDGELNEGHGDLVNALKQDEQLQQKWQRYHLIRDGLRGELGQSTGFDVAASIAAAIEDEPAIVAPKRTWQDLPVVSTVVPLFKQSGQYLVAASVAAALILGVQNYNQPSDSEPFMTATPISGPQGNLTPVSLEQTRSVQRNDMAELLEQRKMINALIADHQRQLQMKQSHQFDKEERVEQKDVQQPPQQP